MADYNEEKTVIVNRDATDRSSPVGLIILLVIMLLIAAFFMMGGMRLFTANDSGGTETPINDTSTPTENTNPIDETTPESTPDQTTPDATDPSQLPETEQ